MCAYSETFWFVAVVSFEENKKPTEEGDISGEA